MKIFTNYLSFLNEANLDMLIAHGLPNGKLENGKQYKWIETTTEYNKDKKLQPITVTFKNMINDEWALFSFAETKNGHNQGDEQKIEIHSIYPLDVNVDGWGNTLNYKYKN